MRTHLRSLIEQARRRENQTGEVGCAMDELASHAIRLAHLAEAVHCFEGGSLIANAPRSEVDPAARRDDMALQGAAV